MVGWRARGLTHAPPKHAASLFSEGTFPRAYFFGLRSNEYFPGACSCTTYPTGRLSKGYTHACSSSICCVIRLTTSGSLSWMRYKQRVSPPISFWLGILEIFRSSRVRATEIGT